MKIKKIIKKIVDYDKLKSVFKALSKTEKDKPEIVIAQPPRNNETIMYSE
jgi:hypothetical protein